MILWNIQKQDAFDSFEKNGVLNGDWRRIVDKSFLEPYKWMAQQMVIRGIMPKPKSFLWAWHTYCAKFPKPDFRTTDFKNQLKHAKTLYRITLDIPESKVLLSNFELWHFVLSNSYIPENEDDWERAYPSCDICTISKEEIEISWQKIFDLELHKKDKDPGIQACIPYISMDWVKKIDRFDG